MTISVSCLIMLVAVTEWLTMGVFSEPKDPILVRHFGKREMMAKIDLMEDRFDLPMSFEEDWVLPNPFVPRQGVGTWGEGIAHVWCSQSHRQQQCTPMLMASMFGFNCEEEMDNTKQYLYSHGGYQLEQVSEWPTVIWFIFRTAWPTVFHV